MSHIFQKNVPASLLFKGESEKGARELRVLDEGRGVETLGKGEEIFVNRYTSYCRHHIAMVIVISASRVFGAFDYSYQVVDLGALW